MQRCLTWCELRALSCLALPCFVCLRAGAGAVVPSPSIPLHLLLQLCLMCNAGLLVAKHRTPALSHNAGMLC